jgi:hypothetical protein
MSRLMPEPQEVELSPGMRTRLYMELGPGLRCIGRSAEAVLEAREAVMAYELAQPRDGHISDAEGPEQDEHEEEHDDDTDDDLHGLGHGDEVLDKVERDPADDKDQQ